MLSTWEIAHRWDTMCEMFSRNAEQFGLVVDPIDEIGTFRRVYENGYVRTIVKQWLSDIPERTPTDAECIQYSPGAETTIVEPRKPQSDVTNMTIELQSEKSDGRYVVIAPGKTIQPGEAVISERAFAMVPVQMHADKDSSQMPPACADCANGRTLESLRCKQCARFSYCSEACHERDSTNRQMHGFECAGYRTGLFDALGISHLAMRTFLLGSGQLERVLGAVPTANGQNVDQLQAFWEEMLCAADQRVGDVAYARVLRLMTNYSKSTAEDVLRYALTAAMFTVYLTDRTDFFRSSAFAAAFGPSVAEILAGALIFRHLGQTVNNAHTILGLIVQSPDRKDSSNSNQTLLPETIPLGGLNTHIVHQVVATALYPRIAMLNHSCNPNISNRFDGARLTICATRPITGGSELLNSYCSVQLDGAERRRRLREQYGFECSCERCSKETSQPEKTKQTETDCIDDDAFLCPACRQRFQANTADRKWWQDPDASDVVLKCPTCKNVVQLDWFHAYMASFEREETAGLSAQQRKWMIEDTCRLYGEGMAAGVVPMGHSLRTFIATLFLFRYSLDELEIFSDDAEIWSILITIAHDYAIGYKQKYSSHSNEFIEASNVWLDMLALRKHLFGTPADDIAEIRTAIECLASPHVRTMYNTYFETYVL